MTRKDYELIARTIREEVDYLNGPVRDSGYRVPRLHSLLRVVNNLQRRFQADNPRFDPDKFTRACGF